MIILFSQIPEKEVVVTSSNYKVLINPAGLSEHTTAMINTPLPKLSSPHIHYANVKHDGTSSALKHFSCSLDRFKSHHNSSIGVKPGVSSPSLCRESGYVEQVITSGSGVNFSGDEDEQSNMSSGRAIQPVVINQSLSAVRDGQLGEVPSYAKNRQSPLCNSGQAIEPMSAGLLTERLGVNPANSSHIVSLVPKNSELSVQMLNSKASCNASFIANQISGPTCSVSNFSAVDHVSGLMTDHQHKHFPSHLVGECSARGREQVWINPLSDQSKCVCVCVGMFDYLRVSVCVSVCDSACQYVYLSVCVFLSIAGLIFRNALLMIII